MKGTMIYVVAGGEKQAAYWAQQNKLRSDMWSYISTPSAIVGATGYYVLVGSYRRRSDWRDMREYIGSRVAVGHLEQINI